MTPKQIYDSIYQYIGNKDTIICNLHSACSPLKGKSYLCANVGSNIRTIDFDSVKELADIEKGIESRKSVDCVVCTPSDSYFCFVELKSWKLLLLHNGQEKDIRKQSKKYESDLPRKFTDSLEICKQIINEGVFDNCKIIYILLTDISNSIGQLSALSNIDANLTALAGTSSNLNMLCNQLSQNIMDNIPNVETRYWECCNFDAELSKL